jgi:antitoxin VapB
MERGSVFMTNKTHAVRFPKQAVRFPKTVRLPEGVTSVDIERRGPVWTTTPSGQGWASWFEGEGVSADFMVERAQPAEQARDGL